jgi:hypothetical protein
LTAELVFDQRLSICYRVSSYCEVQVGPTLAFLPSLSSLLSGTVSASQCYAFGLGTTGGAAGANLSFSIQAADQYGNSITWGTYLFSAAISPSTSSGLALTPTATGVTGAKYSITQAGTYVLSLALNGTIVNGGQNYTIVIGPCKHIAFAGQAVSISERYVNQEFQK